MRTSTPSYVVELPLRVDDQQNRVLEQANSENRRLVAESIRLHEALDKSLQEEAKAQASLQSMKRLLPFLDPKHLDKVCVG